MLLLAVDQKTRIARVRGDQISAPIACGAEEVAGASADFVVRIANHVRCAAAEAAGDRPDNAAFAVSDIFFIECHRFLLVCASLKSCLAFRSVEILLERLHEDVLGVKYTNLMRGIRFWNVGIRKKGSSWSRCPFIENWPV